MYYREYSMIPCPDCLGMGFTIEDIDGKARIFGCWRCLGFGVVGSYKEVAYGQGQREGQAQERQEE